MASSFLSPRNVDQNITVNKPYRLCSFRTHNCSSPSPNPSQSKTHNRKALVASPRPHLVHVLHTVLNITSIFPQPKKIGIEGRNSRGLFRFCFSWIIDCHFNCNECSFSQRHCFERPKDTVFKPCRNIHSTRSSRFIFLYPFRLASNFSKGLSHLGQEPHRSPRTLLLPISPASLPRNPPTNLSLDLPNILSP